MTIPERREPWYRKTNRLSRIRSRLKRTRYLVGEAKLQGVLYRLDRIFDLDETDRIKRRQRFRRQRRLKTFRT